MVEKDCVGHPPSGGILLEDTLGGKGLNGLEDILRNNFGTKLPQKAWDVASGIFAANAKKGAQAVLRNPTAFSVFNRIERPILELLGTSLIYR